MRSKHWYENWQLILGIVVASFAVIGFFYMRNRDQTESDRIYLENAESTWPKLRLANDSLYAEGEIGFFEVKYLLDSLKYFAEVGKDYWGRDTVPNPKWYQDVVIKNPRSVIRYNIENRSNSSINAEILVQAIATTLSDTGMIVDKMLKEFLQRPDKSIKFKILRDPVKIKPGSWYSRKDTILLPAIDTTIYYHLYVLYENDSRKMYYSYYITPYAVSKVWMSDPKAFLQRDGKYVDIRIVDPDSALLSIDPIEPVFYYEGIIPRQEAEWYREHMESIQ